MERRLSSAASRSLFERLTDLTVDDQPRCIVKDEDIGAGSRIRLEPDPGIDDLLGHLFVVSHGADTVEPGKSLGKIPRPCLVTAALIDLVSCRTASVNSTVGSPKRRISQKGLPCSIAPVCFSSPSRSSRAPVVRLMSSNRRACPSSPIACLIEHQNMAVGDALPATCDKARNGMGLDIAFVPSSAAADDVGAKAIRVVLVPRPPPAPLTSVDLPEPATP
jgi:hypothetical protein